MKKDLVAIAVIIGVVGIGVTFWALNDYLRPDLGDFPPTISKLQLDAEREDITSYGVYTEIVYEQSSSTDKWTIKEKIEKVKYIYRTDKIVENEDYKGLKEDISLRTKDQRVYHKENGNKVFRIRGEEPYYEKNGEWYQTEVGLTTKETFEKEMSLSWFEKNIMRVALAASSSTGPYAGDGKIINPSDQTWQNAHDNTEGTADPTTANDYLVYESCWQGDCRMTRGFTPYPTTNLTGTVVSAETSIYVTNKADDLDDGNDFVVAVVTDQGSTATLNDADYNNCGSIGSSDPNTDEVSTRYDLSAQGTAEYLDMAITDLTVIVVGGDTMIGYRGGHDALDVPIVAADATIGIKINFSETAGTATDPVLTVETADAATNAGAAWMGIGF